MANGDQFGPSVGPFTIEQAVINLLATPPTDGSAPLLVYYLADQERQLGLTPRTLTVPPDIASFRGGLDADTFIEDLLPMVHVVVTPDSPPGKLDMNTYDQAWQVELTATASGEGADDPETDARVTAFCYGAALALLIAQHGSLGIGATNTVLTRAPSPSWPDPQTRALCRCSVMFETVTAPAFTFPGPTSLPADPYTAPDNYPDISTVNVTVTAVAP